MKKARSQIIVYKIHLALKYGNRRLTCPPKSVKVSHMQWVFVNEHDRVMIFWRQEKSWCQWYLFTSTSQPIIVSLQLTTILSLNFIFSDDNCPWLVNTKLIKISQLKFETAINLPFSKRIFKTIFLKLMIFGISHIINFWYRIIAPLFLLIASYSGCIQPT